MAIPLTGKIQRTCKIRREPLQMWQPRLMTHPCSLNLSGDFKRVWWSLSTQWMGYICEWSCLTMLQEALISTVNAHGACRVNLARASPNYRCLVSWTWGMYTRVMRSSVEGVRVEVQTKNAAKHAHCNSVAPIVCNHVLCFQWSAIWHNPWSCKRVE